MTEAVQKLPSITNLRDGEWDGAGAAADILNPAARKALIANLADQAQKRGFAGYIFDQTKTYMSSFALDLASASVGFVLLYVAGRRRKEPHGRDLLEVRA